MTERTPLTLDEEAVMEKIIQAHNLFVGLPESHFHEKEQWVKAIHDLQIILFQRKLKRDYPDYFA